MNFHYNACGLGGHVGSMSMGSGRCVLRTCILVVHAFTFVSNAKLTALSPTSHPISLIHIYSSRALHCASYRPNLINPRDTRGSCNAPILVSLGRQLRHQRNSRRAYHCSSQRFCCRRFFLGFSRPIRRPHPRAGAHPRLRQQKTQSVSLPGICFSLSCLLQR